MIFAFKIILPKSTPSIDLADPTPKVFKKDKTITGLLNISNNWGFGDDIIRLVNTANSMGQMRNFEISDSSLITPLIVNIRIGRYPLFIECSDISGNEGSTVVIVPVDP